MTWQTALCWVGGYLTYGLILSIGVGKALRRGAGPDED